MSVTPTNRGRRNPSRIRGSGRPVMKNLTFGSSDTNRPRTDRIAEAGSSSLHSSKASITITVEMVDSLSGCMISSSIWLYNDSWAIPGSDRASGTKIDRNSGYLRASWTARVGKMNWRLLRSSKSREQKNEAPSRPSANILSAIVWAMVLFPVPASPFSQYTGDLPKSLVQCSITSRTGPRVPFRQPLRLPCRYSAPCAERKLLRMAASAIGGLCQVLVVNNGRYPNLGSAKVLLYPF